MNAGATYQQTMNKIFTEQIGRNLEVYIDDMIVKSETRENHIKDLKEIFDTLRKFQLKLKPTKCSFDVSSGKFLGQKIT